MSEGGPAGPPDSPANAPDPSRIYAHRFGEEQAHAKDRIWQVIARHLQRFVPEDARVLDVACDRGDFIRNIRAGEKWATDIRDVSAHLPPDVRFVRCRGVELDQALEGGRFDVIFMSNYLEHLASSDEVIRQLEVTHRLLRSGGRAIVLQPNIRLVGAAYWDFIDHRVPLTEHSLVEAAELAGLETERLIVRFLPYTTRGRLPVRPFLVRAYLAVRPAWALLGKQTLYVGRKPG